MFGQAYALLFVSSNKKTISLIDHINEPPQRIIPPYILRFIIISKVFEKWRFRPNPAAKWERS